MTVIIMLIFFVYLIFAIKYRFLPFGKVKKSLSKKKGFKSLMILLGSSMGVGNIVGVGVAIYLAGPGVIFWMIVSAIISATTNYLEVYHSKRSSNDSYNPISYINNKPMSVIYTILMIITALFIGNMTQINSIKVTLESLNVKLIMIVMIVMFILSTLNYQNISKSLSFIMPFASIIYIVFGIYLIFANYQNLFDAIKLIFVSAFKPEATLGIPFYYVFNQGVLFAIFSNEAGNGSSAMAFKDSNGEPEELGITASLCPIIDTAIICVLTGLIILTSDLFKDLNYRNYNPNDIIYIVLIYENAFGLIGKIIMSSLVVLFAFATLLSWFYYARMGVKYLKINYVLFYFIYIFFIGLSMYLKLTFLMDLTNYFNIMLLFINLAYLLKKVFMVK